MKYILSLYYKIMIKTIEVIQPQTIISNKKVLLNPKEKPREKIIYKVIRIISGAFSYVS